MVAGYSEQPHESNRAGEQAVAYLRERAQIETLWPQEEVEEWCRIHEGSYRVCKCI
jgi:hypothetical protein